VIAVDLLDVELARKVIVSSVITCPAAMSGNTGGYGMTKLAMPAT
jgi:hypothetical protein